MPKKQKEAKLLAELEERTMVEAERKYKIADRDKKLTEKVDKHRRNLEQDTLEKEKARLQREKEEFVDVKRENELSKNLALAEFQKHKEWESVVKVSTLPDVNSEAEINSVLSVWRSGDHEVVGNEERKRDLDVDFDQCAQGIELASQIQLAVDQGEEESLPTSSKKAKKMREFHHRNLSNIYAEIHRTIDAMTSNIMQYLDKYVDEGDEQALTLCKSNDSVLFGLWCGNKLPRIRNVDFPQLKITMAPKEGAHLPRQLSLMSNAVRVLHYQFDPVSVLENEEDGHNFYALGGVLIIETLNVPPAVKTSSKWVIRTETSHAHNVQRMPYPPAPSADASAAPAAPVRITFQVPERVVVRGAAPIVGIWKDDSKSWQPDGTGEFTYDPRQRKATCVTQHLTSMAVILEKGFDIPYEQWYIFPQSVDTVTFVIDGRKRHDKNDAEIHIQIHGDKCRVSKPDIPELEYLRDSWFTPATLLRHLKNSGFNFLLSDKDANFLPDIIPKDWVMENKGYDDIALFCTTFAFSGSRHNKWGEDSTMTLFRVSKQMRGDGPLCPDLESDAKWNTIRYHKERCVICRATESEESPNVEEAQGRETHYNLYKTLAAEFSTDEINSRITSTNLLLQNTVKHMLSLTRPFTWG